MTGSAAIIDANVSLKMVLPDPFQGACQALIHRLVEHGFELVAPALWAYETTSTICRAVHLGQISSLQGEQALSATSSLGIRLLPPDADQDRRSFEWTLRLRRGSAYDSYYLALAELLGCDLWTADQRLVNAARAPWVRWAGEV